MRPSGVRAGFTLIESLMAATVLAVGVAGVGAALSATYRNETFAREEALAVQIAADTVERVSAYPVVGTGGSAGSGSLLSFDGLIETVTHIGSEVLGMPYTKRIVVREVERLDGPDRPGGPLVILTVAVDTPGGRQVEVRRVIARR